MTMGNRDDSREDGVLGEGESRCVGGCCVDDKGRESNAGNCEDSCSGHGEDHVTEVPTNKEDPPGTGYISSHSRVFILIDADLHCTRSMPVPRWTI